MQQDMSNMRSELLGHHQQMKSEFAQFGGGLKNVVQTEKDLKALFPKASWNSLHLQIIFFGREYCPARHHDLSACPICGWAATKTRIEAERRMNAPKTRGR